MAPADPKRAKIFISYSHKDREWLDRLQVHLKPLERDGLIERWDDTVITPGRKWKEEFEEALRAAKVVVLLVSANFLASDFIVDNELPPLLWAAEREGLVVLPVLLSPSRFIHTPSLSQFQAVNDPRTTLAQMVQWEQDEVFVTLTETIASILQDRDSPSEHRTHVFSAQEALPPPKLPEVSFAVLPSPLPNLDLPSYKALSDEELKQLLDAAIETARTNTSSNTLSQTKTTKGYYIRAKHIPVLGVCIAGLSKIWGFISGLLSSNDTVQRIALYTLLLFSWLFAPIVIYLTKKDGTTDSLTLWLVLYFFCFGIVATATGIVMTNKYHRSVDRIPAAESTLSGLKSEGASDMQRLAVIWEDISPGKRDDEAYIMDVVRQHLEHDNMLELEEKATIFVRAKSDLYKAQDLKEWSMFFILAIVIGVENIICSIILGIIFLNTFPY